ncbi:MAG: OsmC family protein [Chloroflexi bacterium]|nr:OsmC family protein [Chloroflexota bacterium]
MRIENLGARMNKLNNVDVGSLDKAKAAAAKGRSKVKRTQGVEGEWLLDENEHAQFRAQVSFENGKMVLEADQPTFLGGGGQKPGPLHYCFYGVAACYASTYANVASEMGIRLRRLSAKVEAKLDFSKVFGLADNPIVEEVKVILTVRGQASKAKLEEVERMAQERCPAAYTLTHIVPLKSALAVQEHVSKEEVMEVLKCVYDPDYLERSLVDMGLVTMDDIEVSNGVVKVKYGLSAPICPFSAAIGLTIKHALQKRLGVEAEVRLKPGHYQYEVVNEVLSDEEKSAELMQKLKSYGVLERCVR